MRSINLKNAVSVVRGGSLAIALLGGSTGAMPEGMRERRLTQPQLLGMSVNEVNVHRIAPKSAAAILPETRLQRFSNVLNPLHLFWHLRGSAFRGRRNATAIRFRRAMPSV